MNTNLSNSDRPLGLDDAQSAIDLFDFELARTILRSIIRRNPSADAYYLAANVALDESQRVLLLQRALELDPSHVKALAALHGAVDAGASPSSAVVAKLPEKIGQAEIPPGNSENTIPTSHIDEIITNDNIVAPLPTNYRSSSQSFSDNQPLKFQIGGYRIASPGAVVAVICFFLPWAVGSCSSSIVTVTGMFLLTTWIKGLFSKDIDGSVILKLLFLVLLLTISLVVALWVFYLSISLWRHKSALNRRDGDGLIALGVLSLTSILIFIKWYVSFKQFIPFLFGVDVASDGVLQIRYGLYGTIFGHIAIIIGGILNRRILLLSDKPYPQSSDFDLVPSNNIKSDT